MKSPTLNVSSSSPLCVVREISTTVCTYIHIHIYLYFIQMINHLSRRFTTKGTVIEYRAIQENKFYYFFLIHPNVLNIIYEQHYTIALKDESLHWCTKLQKDGTLQNKAKQGRNLGTRTRTRPKSRPKSRPKTRPRTLCIISLISARLYANVNLLYKCSQRQPKIS